MAMLNNQIVFVLTFSGLPDQHKSWLAASDAERAHRRVGTHVGILTSWNRSKGRALSRTKKDVQKMRIELGILPSGKLT